MVKSDKNRKIYSVSEVNYFARQTLEQMELWVEGEITTFKKNPSWRFYYLDLKDDTALLPCISDSSVFDEFEMQDLVGLKILAFGFLTLYELRGSYQFKILRVEAAGEGIMQKKLEELIKKLKGEGLFDAQGKKVLPIYPKKVCIVTSGGSDAWNDFKKHTVEKFPIIELYTADVRVQGVNAVPDLLKVLPMVDNLGFDVVVLTRGGGSLEDLAAFNDESVARVIYSMKTPTLVAIGHEANESLAEWVADRRASTPTDAANIVTLGYMEFLEKLEGVRTRIKIRADNYFSVNFQRLDNNFRGLSHVRSYFKDLPHRLDALFGRLNHFEKYLVVDTVGEIDVSWKNLEKFINVIYFNQVEHLTQLEKSLRLLSPKNTLERGYAIATDSNGRVLKSVNAVVVGDMIGVKLSTGSLTSEVKSKKRHEETYS